MRRLIFPVIMLLVLAALLTGSAFAQGSGPEFPTGPLAPQAAVGTAFTYQGRLTSGGALAGGLYDFQFKLFNAASGGAQVGSTVTKTNVNVGSGLFTVSLDFGTVFDGTALWLQIAVRRAGSGNYTTLAPRQALSATPYALGLLPGASLKGDGAAVMSVTNTFSGSGATYGLVGVTNSAGGAGVQGAHSHPTGNGAGVLGYTSSTNLGAAVIGWSLANSGTNYGVYGRNSSSAGYGGYFENQSSDGVAIYATGSGGTRSKATLRVDNTETSNGMAAYLTNSSAFANVHLSNSGTGQVLWLQNGGTNTAGAGGGDFITAVNKDGAPFDVQFRVATDGTAYSDTSFNGGGADFAEMLPGVEGLESGDVLAVGPDGRLTRSTQPYQASVVGVYSTKPGFVGGSGPEEDLSGKVPLAVLGVVPVKASAENGPIQPGDWLAAASLPGHAMRCQGVEACFGRTLGKALEGLDSGTGLIHMLVTLQ